MVNSVLSRVTAKTNTLSCQLHAGGFFSVQLFTDYIGAYRVMVYEGILSPVPTLLHEPQIHFLIVCVINSPQSFRYLVVSFYPG